MILLIRHGETALNVARVVQPADTPLSENGLRQAQLLAERVTKMSELRVEHILASDLPRASATAAALARATGAPVQETALLQERNFGDLRGTPYQDMRVDLFAREFEPPGGESWPEFEQRVDRAWEFVVRFAATREHSLAVVTHGLVCGALAGRCLQLPAGQSMPARWGNTSLTLCDREAPHAVHLLNCTAHLGPGGDNRAAPSGL